MPVNIFSAGKGEGKTSFLRRYAAWAVDRGRSVGGVACPAVFEGGQRVGYDLIDLHRDNRRPLARVVTSADITPTVGMYRFDDDAVAEGNAAILAALRERLDIIAIDEVGPLEFRGGGWTPGLETALEENDSEQELIVVVRPALVDKLPTRFPSPRWAAARRISPPWPTTILA